MSFKGSSSWKAASFDNERTLHQREFDDFRRCAMGEPHGKNRPFIKRDNGDWILFGPQDVREGSRRYYFALQRLACDRVLRVRVGCRFYTLEQAWHHWHTMAKRSCWSVRRRACQQAIAIIQLMILQAQAYGLINRYKRIPFDSSLNRKKRK